MKQQQQRLFASCLLAAASSALQLGARTSLAATQYAKNGELNTASLMAEPESECCNLFNNYDYDPKVVCLSDDNPAITDDMSDYTWGSLETSRDLDDGSSVDIYWTGVDCAEDVWIVLRNGQTGNELAQAGKIRNRWTETEEQEYQHKNFTLGAYDESVMPALNLYGAEDCQGTDNSFLMYNEDRGSFAGEFGSSDITMLRRDNKIKSVGLRSGYSVTLYAEDNWKGTSQTITGAYESTADGRLACQNVVDSQVLTSGVNSLRIKRHEQGQSTGYWRGMTSTEAQTFSFSVGISTSTSDTSSSSAVDTLQKSNSLGFNASLSVGVTASTDVKVKTGFMGNGASAKVGVEVSAEASAGVETSESYETAMTNEISREISSTAAQDITHTHETTCTPAEGDTRVGLWQYVISSEDNSVQAYTPHTVCRSGDLAAVAPTCSWWDCYNQDCSVCITDVVDDLDVTEDDSDTAEEEAA